MALALSYDSGTDTLTITGGTSGTPYTWEDVWDYDNGTVTSTNNGTGTIDGSEPITTVMDKCGTGSYHIKSNIVFGDGSTVTHFQSKLELIYFDDGKEFQVADEAHLYIGEKSGDWGINGSTWSFAPSATMNMTKIGGTHQTEAVVGLYASTLINRSDERVQLYAGDKEVINTTLLGSDPERLWYIGGGSYGSYTLKSVYAANCYLQVYQSPTEMNDIHVHSALYGLLAGYSDLTAENCRFTDIANSEVFASGGTNFTVSVLDPTNNLSTPTIADNTVTVEEQYTCNIKVVDEQGNAIQGVTVKCEDTIGSEVFSVTTDASGVIAEQVITYKQWAGTSETETAYSPHKFVISKDGLSEKVIANVTVAGAIEWVVQLGKLRNQVRSCLSNPARLRVIR